MTRDDAIKVLTVLKAAYPNFYKNMTKQEAQGVVSIWASQFAGIPVEIVLIAVNKLIATNTFPPAVAEVKAKLKNMYYESISDLAQIEQSDPKYDVLLQINKYCYSIPDEPGIMALCGEGGLKIEAHDKQGSDVSALQARR